LLNRQLGFTRKFLHLESNVNRALNLSLGVDGSFDIIAGRTKRAPVWMQQSGLEWFYRILQEPRRMWKRYAKTNPVFVWMVLKEYIKLKEVD